MSDKTVLCVDDEVRVLRSLQRELVEEPYEVVMASSGQEGLACMEAVEVALVVSDQRMPGMTGVEFLEKVRKRWPDTFRIMLTGHADLDTVTAAVNEGEVHRFLRKPWNSDELKQTVRQGMERYRLMRENRELMRLLEARNEELQTLNQTLEERVAERTRQLDLAYRELVQSEKLSAVGRLAAGVVHEVLNPLAVVVGRIDMMLMDRTLDTKHQGSLEIAREQVDRAVKIMDNLRDFSKQRPPNRTQVDLNSLAADTLELVVHETRRRSIQVTRQLDGLPGVQADQDQLSQVFLNLINNAIQAMEKGGSLTVTTRFHPDGGGGGSVEVGIADTGAGISEAMVRSELGN